MPHSDAGRPREPLPQLSQPADKKRVTRYAEELDEQAARLEKQAADMRRANASLGRELVNGGVARTSASQWVSERA